MKSRDRYGTVNQRSRRLPKNSTIRLGASRIDSALRDGGVSTITRSNSPLACRSWSCSIARYSWLCTNRLVMFSYSGLASTASRISASGACRVINSSQPALVSSIATHTSPRTFTPGIDERCGIDAHRGVAELVDAEGSRQAPRRIDGQHEHPALLAGRRGDAERSSDRRLADATGAGDKDHLATGEKVVEIAHRRPFPPCRRRRLGIEFIGECVRHERHHPRARSPGEQFRHGDDRQLIIHLAGVFDPTAQPIEMRRSLRSSGLGQAGGVDDRARSGTDCIDEDRHRIVESIDDRLFAATEHRRQHPVGDHRRRMRTRLGTKPREQFDRLGDRHLLRRGHHRDAGARRIVEDVEHPLGLITNQPDLDEIGDHPGGTDLADDVSARLGVDDDEVVVALAHLPAELAHAENLLDARRCVGNEVERRRQRADPSEERNPHEEPQVFTQRVLGVHGHRVQIRRHLGGFELQRSRRRTHWQARPWHPSRRRVCGGHGALRRRQSLPRRWSCRRLPCR